MTKTKLNQKGFTIVELLIVIVVIAILAAISIVAYNGIQNRANESSSKESASQLKNKIEAWNSIKGAYPTTTDLSGGLAATDAKEANLDSTLTQKISASTPTKDKPVQYTVCPATGTVTGYTIKWWTGSGTSTDSFVVGTC